MAFLKYGLKEKFWPHETIRGVAVARCNGFAPAIHKVTDVHVQGLFEMVQYDIGGCYIFRLRIYGGRLYFRHAGQGPDRFQIFREKSRNLGPYHFRPLGRLLIGHGMGGPLKGVVIIDPSNGDGHKGHQG